MTAKLRRLGAVGTIVFAAVFVGSAANAQKAAQTKPLTYEQRLTEKIKQEVMKELREGDFLREQIELGIQEYTKKQQEAQVAARAQAGRQANEKVKNVRRVSTARDHIYGNPEAAISIIEYSDFECPFCKRFHATPKELVQTYAGKVNWVYRHFPLAFHNPGAQKQAEASECAGELGGNDAFWKYSDAIYTRTQSNGKGFPLTQLVPLAKEIGLDEDKFRRCVDSDKYASRVQEDLTEGAQVGVTGTPASVILNNQTGEARFKSGAQPIAAFKADVEAMLK